MVRRTQQRCFYCGALARWAGRAGSFSILCLALAGCAEPETPAPPHLTQGDRLSVYGDNLMIEGRKIRDQGIATGDDVMKHRGEAMIGQGQILITKATEMTDQPEAAKPVPGITHSAY